MLFSNFSTNKTLKIVVLGSPKCGKSAVTVRYLTKRFIGEYSSSKDFLYHQTLNFTNHPIEIEILDTSDCKTNNCLYNHIAWGEAFIIIYSVSDLKSFKYAKKLIETICKLKNCSNKLKEDYLISNKWLESNNNLYFDENSDYKLNFDEDKNFQENQENICININNQFPIILLGNKRDLEHVRQVVVEEGQEFALKFQCQFYEVSAAESSVGVSLAFQSLIKEARPNFLKNENLSKKNSLNNFDLNSNLKKNNSLLTTKSYCCGYSENNNLNDSLTTKSNTINSLYFNTNTSRICSSNCSSDTSLKINNDKFDINVRRKSMTVSKMIGIMFGSKFARQKKRPSLSI